jgi:cobalt/nickel transport system permease protein
MHIPDGFINAGTSLGAGVAAVGGLSVAVKQAARQMEDRHIPMAGLVAAFVFAVQMLNFPVAAGTSGHLIGGVLAAILVGPWAGAMAVAVVLVVQTLFADGGITALGLNVLNMSLVSALGGYGIFLLVRRVLPRNRSGMLIATGFAAGASVLLSAAAFTLEYWIGGNGTASATAVGTAMLGVHTLIGIGEGIITASTIGTVLAVRPDLVHGASHLAPVLLTRVERMPERTAA